MSESSPVVPAGVRVGMTRGELRELLGDPPEVGGVSRRWREPTIWRYGALEYWFGKTAAGVLHTVWWERGVEGGEVLLGGD